eukprot:1646686-Pleurochrysis_carterae.AAC.1
MPSSWFRQLTQACATRYLQPCLSLFFCDPRRTATLNWACRPTFLQSLGSVRAAQGRSFKHSRLDLSNNEHPRRSLLALARGMKSFCCFVRKNGVVERNFVTDTVQFGCFSADRSQLKLVEARFGGELPLMIGRRVAEAADET